jgi:hypothetical protein
MGITHMGHQVVVLGYITDSTGNISRVIIHDPDESMYKSERWAHISRPWAFETVHTRVIENIAPRYTDGISINVLSRKEGLEEKQGVTFKSPMNNEINRRHFFRNGDIRFGWCRSETKEHGYVSHDGTGITVGAIPNYYAMKLNLRVANTNSSRDAVYNPSQLKVKWYMTKMTGSGGTAENYSGEHTDHAVGTLVSAKFKFRQDSFQDLEGDYLLHVTASDQAGEKIYDEFSISLSFDKGIKLSVEKGPDDQAPSKQVVKLTWTAFSGDFDKYEVFRRYSVTSDWTSIGEVSKDTTKYSDDDSRSLLEDEVYYGVVAKKGKKIIITSNMAKLEKVQGHLAYRFAYFDDQQNLETGIGFFYLPTSETWEWYSNPGHDLHLIGVTPSGRVAAAVGDIDVNSNEACAFVTSDQVLVRDDWGVADPNAMTDPCWSSSVYYSGLDREADMADSGVSYFTGTYTVLEAIDPEHPEYGQACRSYDYIFSCDGSSCNKIPIDIDGDGEVDDLTTSGIQHLTVAEQGNKLVFEAYSLGSLGVADTDGSNFKWLLNSNCGGAIKISDDGSRCLFALTSDGNGFDALATISTSGGSPTNLSEITQPTGLIVQADSAGISPDGSLVCAIGVSPSSPQEMGFAVIHSNGSQWIDGSPYYWLDTGTVQAAQAPRFTADGQNIVFTGVDTAGGVDPDSPDVDTDIYMMRVDGTETPKNLTNTPNVKEAYPYLH